MFQSEIDVSKRLSFLPPGRLTTLKLRVSTQDSDLLGASEQLFDLIGDFLAQAPSLPQGWNNFESLRAGIVITKNLSGISTPNQTISPSPTEEILHIEGDDTSIADEDRAPLSVEIFTKFHRTIRLGENEYQFGCSTPPELNVASALSLLKSPTFKPTLLRFGVAHFRRFAFGPISNPFPLVAGSLALILGEAKLNVSASYFNPSDLPELDELGGLLAKHNISDKLTKLR